MEAHADRSFGTVAVAASLLAIGLAAIYWIARIGFVNPLETVVANVALSLFMINSPYVARMITRRVSPNYTWAKSYSFYWLLATLLVTVSGRLVPITGVNVFAALAAIGLVAFVITFLDWIRGSALWRSAIIIVGSLIFSTFAGGVVWGRIYKSPLFMEMLSVDGIVHHDPISVAGMASMLRTYGVPSVGLDGLAYLPYHWGSPWMFAQMSELLDAATLDFYNFGYVVTMLPFLFGGVLCFATEVRNVWIRRARPTPGLNGDLRNNLWLAGLFLVASIGVIPITGMDALGVWTSNPMISESYAASLPVALLLLATTIVFWEKSGREIGESSMRLSDWVLVAVVLPLGILALGFLKISFMVLGFLVAMYAALRMRLYKRPAFMALGIAFTAATAFTYTLVLQPGHREGLAPLDFLKGFVPPAWWPFFFVVHLFWAWLYVALRLRGEGLLTLSDVRIAFRERRLLDVEVVVLVAIAGVLPGFVIHIDGGSAFYFSDIQRWLSVGLIIAGTGTLLHQRRFSFRRAPLATRILIVLLAVPMLYSMVSNATYWTKRMLIANSETRRALYPAEVASRIPAGLRGLPMLRDPALLQSGLAATKNHPVISDLRALGELPLAERRKTAVFIPQSEARYWNLLARPGACSFAGHIAPTLTGMTLVDGMPAYGCTLSRYYGLGIYQKRGSPQTPADTLPSALCRRVSKYGISRIMTLHFSEAGRATQRVDECQNAL